MKDSMMILLRSICLFTKKDYAINGILFLKEVHYENLSRKTWRSG